MSSRVIAGRRLLFAADIPEPGTWYRTDDDVDGIPVWVRVPREDEGHEDDDAIQRAWERLRHIEHPSVPRALHYAPEARSLFVTAPVGVPMSRLLDHRQEPAFAMTPGTVLDVGARIADVLVHAHERGRPHGHLSPDEIWVTPSGQLVVWGFAIGPDHVGSPRWWSPERARGRRSSGDADQWALGAILSSLITGRIPWRGEDPVSDARVGDATHLSGPVMEQWKPLGRLLDRALSPEARDRFPSVHPVRQALEAMRQRVGQPTDLARMGEALLERHGPVEPPPSPDTMEPEDVPAPAAMAALQVPAGVPVADDAATSVSDAPPPLDGLGDGPVVAIQLDDVDAEDPTDRLTIPTSVPNEGDEDSEDDALVDASVDDAPFESVEEDEAFDDTDQVTAPVVRGSAASFDPLAPLAEVDVESVLPDGEPSLGDLTLAERTHDPQDDPKEWYEVIDSRRIAPWTAAALGITLVLYWFVL